MRDCTKGRRYINVFTIYLSLLILYGIIFLLKSFDKKEEVLPKEFTAPISVSPSSSSLTPENAVKKVSKCFKDEFNSWKDYTTSFWLEIPNTVKKCTDIIANKIPYIEGTPKCLEHKYYMIPRSNHINDSCSILTFGIGGDIDPELHMKMSMPQCTFLGFDPNEKFKNIFEDGLGGKFVHTAVGGKTGKGTIYKLQNNAYAKQPKTKIKSAAELIKTFHGEGKLIDILNIDVEGSEYGIFEQIYQDSIFQNVCQINVELHPVWYHEAGYSFFDVIKIFENIAADGTFVWIKAHIHATQFFPSYFINVKNQFCVEKYLLGRLFSTIN